MTYATSVAQEIADHTGQRWAQYVIDSRKDDRLKGHQKCKTCYYLRGDGISLQGFHKYTCAICGLEKSYPVSGPPIVCPECAKLKKLCAFCGADIEMNDRRRKV
jgi:hypothetical protein